MHQRAVTVDSLREAVGQNLRGQRLWLLRGLLAAGVLLAPDLFATDRAAGHPAPLTSECTARANGWLQPGLVTAGGAVHVATRITFSCPDRRQAYHLVIVIDGTLWDGGSPGATLPARTAALLDALALWANPDIAVGLVTYDSEAELVCSLTNDRARLEDCIERLIGVGQANRGGQALAQALYEARKALLVGRESWGAIAGRPVRETALVVAWPPAVEAIAAAADAASVLRTSGIEVLTVDESSADGQDALRSVADPGRAYGSRDWPSVMAEQEQRAWSTSLRIRQASVHEFLSQGVRPLLESADPANPGYDAGRHVLEWVLPLEGQDSIHLSYTAQVTLPGNRPLRQLGYGVFRDSMGLRGAFTLPQADLVVVEGRIQQAYVPLASRFSSSSIKTAASRH